MDVSPATQYSVNFNLLSSIWQVRFQKRDRMRWYTICWQFVKQYVMLREIHQYCSYMLVFIKGFTPVFQKSEQCGLTSMATSKSTVKKGWGKKGKVLYEIDMCLDCNMLIHFIFILLNKPDCNKLYNFLIWKLENKKRYLSMTLEDVSGEVTLSGDNRRCIRFYGINSDPLQVYHRPLRKGLAQSYI